MVRCGEAVETTPESGVFYCRTNLLVTHLLDEGSGTAHDQVVADVRQALESLPLPAVDEEWELRVYGVVILRLVPANEDAEQGTLFELNIGCGVLEKQEGGPVNTPNEA